MQTYLTQKPFWVLNSTFSFQKRNKMGAKFRKKSGKQKTAPVPVARKSKTILRRKIERQEKKQAKKQKKKQFYVERFTKVAEQQLHHEEQKTKKGPKGRPAPPAAEVNQRTQKQLQDLAKQQKEQRKGRSPHWHTCPLDLFRAGHATIL